MEGATKNWYLGNNIVLFVLLSSWDCYLQAIHFNWEKGFKERVTEEWQDQLSGWHSIFNICYLRWPLSPKQLLQQYRYITAEDQLDLGVASWSSCQGQNRQEVSLQDQRETREESIDYNNLGKAWWGLYLESDNRNGGERIESNSQM